MNCDRYETWWHGGLDDEAFAAHRESCAECAEAWRLDARLEEEARALPAPSTAPGLWGRIAAELEDEAPVPAPARRRRFLAVPRVWATAAVLILAVGLGAVALRDSAGPTASPRNLLATEALARVEAAEAEYESAIRELEDRAEPVLAEADLRLALRYRQRLEIIDAQIRDCREMLARDNANAHIRRYLLAAYRDKTETLTELLALADG